MDRFETHFCNYRFYSAQFSTPRNNHYHVGFLSPRVAFIRKGKCVVETDKGRLYLKEGTTWYLPRFYPYSSHWTADPEVEFVAFEFEANAFSASFRDMQAIDGLPLADTFARLEENCRTNDEFAALSAFYEILATLKPHLQETHRDIPQSVLQSVEQITRNYRADFRVADLAGDCYLSESRFYFLFKKATGFSPVDYKNYLKINHAVGALQGGSTIEDICEEYGFCSPSYFRRLLKKFTGKSPSEFKKDYKKL